VKIAKVPRGAGARLRRAAPGPGCAGRCRVRGRGQAGADAGRGQGWWEAVAAVARWRRSILAGLTPFKSLTLGARSPGPL